MSTYRHPGTVLTDHTFLVPLDHGRPDGEQIEVFAREIVAASKADRADDLPWLVFLQGGPGMAAGRMIGRESWLDRALHDYRVLLLDQRGTGRSSRITARSLARLGSARAQAEYLGLFRADSIVLDAELIRRELAGEQPWSVLGQSFGGFCAVTYLSFAPHGMREALITGGLPGLDAHPDDVYRITYPVVAARNAAHYDRYPDDVDRARDIARYLATHDVRLPGGTRLTVEAFQSIGHMLGSSTGSHELHYLLENPWDGDGGLADAFLHQFGEFDAACAVDGAAPLLFTGEMIYPWMVGNDPALRPLREAADLLAAKDDWPPLSDPARLGASEVPAAAAVYYNDMYVPRELSMRTAARIRGLKPWVTSEYEHDGLRVSAGKVLARLIAMNRGEA